MSYARTRGVCLRAIDYSETSQVLHFFTRDSGKVHAIAKGSKRSKSRFGGPLDLLCEYDLVRVEKAEALDILTEADLLDAHAGLRRAFARFACACYAVDLVGTFSPPALVNAELYDLLARTLRTLEACEDLEFEVFRFEARALRFLGLLPRAADCGVCKKPIAGDSVQFSPRDGGAVCMACRPRDPARVVVGKATLDALVALGQGRDATLHRGARGELRFVVNQHLAYHAERSLQTWRSFPRFAP